MVQAVEVAIAVLHGNPQRGNNMWKRFFEWLCQLFGKSERVKIKGAVCMPLFYPRDGGGHRGTWDYLNKSLKEQDECRWWIKHLTAEGETPAIAFLLTPPHQAGNIFTPWPYVNDDNIEYAREAIEKCVEDGIAVFPVLYTDDLPPWWYSIGDEITYWPHVHGVIGKHVNGYILSIETNEQARDVGTIQECIAMMESAMPDMDYYGVHMAWMGKGRYRWMGGDTTPFNANLILAETSWHPKDGDRAGVDKCKKEVQAIIANNPGVKICLHEYNWNCGAIHERQRAMLRTLGLWGVG